MGFDAATDDLIDAFRLVVGDGVNLALGDKYGEDPIVVTHGYPITLDQLPHAQLPALSVYRVSDSIKSNGGRTDDTRTVMNLDYFGPSIGFADINDCWPLLREVWSSALSIICDDEDGTLALVGVQALLRSSVLVNYSFATDGSISFPFFSARLTVDSRAAAESSLPPFRGMTVDHRLFANGVAVDTDKDPIVQQQVVSGFTTGFGVGLW